jgi:hypothetical protein
MRAQIVERPLCFGLSAAEAVHEDVYADRVRKPLSALEEFDFTIIDGLFWGYFEIGLSLEAACFEKGNDFIVVVWGDDEVEVGRESRLELTDRVPSNENEPDV